MPLVTFIVPTIGRVTLRKTVQSLDDQVLPDWGAVIVLDGEDRGLPAMAPSPKTAPHFILHCAERTNSAGLTRNVGLELAKLYMPSEWIAFVDDDDHLSPYYVWSLKEHAVKMPKLDVIVFRMKDPRLGILPDPESPELKHTKVGISFAVKRRFLERHDLRFIREDLLNQGPKGNEDIELLTRMLALGAEVFISPNVVYYVREASL